MGVQKRGLLTLAILDIFHARLSSSWVVVIIPGLEGGSYPHSAAAEESRVV